MTDNVLQIIPSVCVSIDDILVTGRVGEEHLLNLDKVLSRLAKAGLKLNVNTCRGNLPLVYTVVYSEPAIGNSTTKQIVDKDLTICVGI